MGFLSWHFVKKQKSASYAGRSGTAGTGTMSADFGAATRGCSDWLPAASAAVPTSMPGPAKDPKPAWRPWGSGALDFITNAVGPANRAGSQFSTDRFARALVMDRVDRSSSMTQHGKNSGEQDVDCVSCTNAATPAREMRSMSLASPTIRNCSRRLVALEAERDGSSDVRADGAVRVCEMLRLRLTKLIGAAGFRSLLSRALAMAKTEVSSLDAVRVGTDGSLEGFDGKADAEAGVAVVSQLLGLLVIFVGEPLTIRLVRDAWPNTSVAGMDLGSGEGL